MPSPQLDGDALAAVRHRGSHLQIIALGRIGQDRGRVPADGRPAHRRGMEYLDTLERYRRLPTASRSCERWRSWSVMR